MHNQVKLEQYVDRLKVDYKQRISAGGAKSGQIVCEKDAVQGRR